MVILSAYFYDKNILDYTRICVKYCQAAPAILLIVCILEENDGAFSNCAEHITSAERRMIIEITMYLFLHDYLRRLVRILSIMSLNCVEDVVIKKDNYNWLSFYFNFFHFPLFC